MKAVFITIGIIIFGILFYFTFRFIKVKSQNEKLNRQRFERIKPLMDKLDSGQTISIEEVLPYATNLLTRESTFELLHERNRLDIFPKEYYSIVKGAESNLANWLEFPTELDACPDEIEHMKRVTMDLDGKGNCVHYEVFKYRVNEPHWAAKFGWMLGVVGPYSDDSKPYDFPGATFSRISSTPDKVTPEEEVKWVHDNISMRIQ